MAAPKKFNPKAKTKKVPVKTLAKTAITLLGPGKFGKAAKAGTKAVKHLVKQAKAKKLGTAAVKKAKRKVVAEKRFDAMRNAVLNDEGFTMSPKLARWHAKPNHLKHPFNKLKKNNSPMSSLTGKVQKQQGSRPYSKKNPSYKNPTKRINTKDMERVDVSDLKFKNNDPFGNMSYKEQMKSIEQTNKIAKKIAKKRGFKIPSDKIPY
tara:strand:- start:252 stop:872 length:621 start_codon:yes stop_codon:yes gene_type:complete